MCVTADNILIYYKSVMNTRTKNSSFSTAVFLLPTLLKMLEKGLNTEVLGILEKSVEINQNDLNHGKVQSILLSITQCERCS